MIQIGKTIILNENESLYDRTLSIKQIHEAANIIQIHSVTGEITFLKVKRLKELKEKL
jgi:hypothetical protein